MFARDNLGVTTLHRPASRKNDGIVRLLLDERADTSVGLGIEYLSPNHDFVLSRIILNQVEGSIQLN